MRDIDTTLLITRSQRYINETGSVDFSLLKVPKCEIFDLSDFPDFYTIKSLRVGDFGVKIKTFLKNI
jgi:hypothetical protein